MASGPGAKVSGEWGVSPQRRQVPRIDHGRGKPPRSAAKSCPANGKLAPSDSAGHCADDDALEAHLLAQEAVDFLSAPRDPEVSLEE